MGKYLLIESRDPYQSADTTNFYDLAADLVQSGNDVTVFLVQNGVLPARKGAAESPMPRWDRVNVLADEFALRERAITANKLAEGITPAPIEQLVDLLVEPGVKAIWH